jgi:hypothetical protein
MAYYYGFLFTIIVNSVVWFCYLNTCQQILLEIYRLQRRISACIKIYWTYKKEKTKNNFIVKDDKNTLSEGVNADNYSASNDISKKETDNLGSPLKL